MTKTGQLRARDVKSYVWDFDIVHIVGYLDI